MSAAEARAQGTVVPSRRRPPASRPMWPSACVGAAIFALGYENGGYGLTARTVVALGVWLVLVVAVGLSSRPSRVQLPTAALVPGALLSALAAWTLASAFWAPSAERAFVEFDRVALYVGVYLLAVTMSSRRHDAAWTLGLLLAIDAIVVVSLFSRLVPGVFGSRGLATAIPTASTRLSFPFGYWNGLAIFAAFSVPLGIAAAAAARTRLARAAAVAPLPLAAVVVVLASSRGGALSLLVGLVVVVATSGQRWMALRIAGVVVAGSAVAVAVERAYPVLANGPLATPGAAHAGHVVAALLLVAVLVTGAAQVGCDEVSAGRRPPSAAVGRALLAAVIVVVVALVIAAHPMRGFDAFRRLPPTPATTNFATAHLTSGNGSGRWQFWAAAVHEWESAPLAGRGAGSYQGWWAQHASFPYALKNAHSLYFETLGELGLVGLLLLVAALAAGFGRAARNARVTRAEDRERIAGASAVAAAFFVTAAIDWTWQLTAVAVVGVAALGLAAGARATPSARDRVTRNPRTSLVIAGFVVACALIVAEAIPWLSAASISASQAAARNGDLAAAAKDALDAKALEPWAATPYLQLALVAEANRDLVDAQHWIRAASARDTNDWSVWLVAARIEAEAGAPATARRDYARSRLLNPRSPVFAGGLSR